MTTERIEALALILDDICAWDQASKVLNHSGWIDVLECLQQHSPKAFEELCNTYTREIIEHADARDAEGDHAV